MLSIQNYINGKYVSPVGGQYFENYNPARGSVYSTVPDSDEHDVELAVQAAEAAFPIWSKTPVEKRSEIMLKIAQLIAENLDELADAESEDSGKPIWLCKQLDIPRARDNFHFFATAILHYAANTHATDDIAINYTLRHPIGVVGCISPWNLPLYLFTWKIAPAIAAGNCVVAKPSELTPYTAHKLGQICTAAGLPPGVLNIVHGYGYKAGAAITAHPKTKAISFTGGTKTGAEIARVAAPMFKKLSLELGGKNPNIIFADCDFARMLDTTVRSSFLNQGEICLCGSRIFVERSLYDKFKTAFVEKVKNLKVGDPLNNDSFMGALVSRQHMEKVLGYIDLAKEEGGTILCGGERVNAGGHNADGWFVAPTVIEGLPYDCRTNQEEIFGPVVTLIPFDTEDEALKMANGVGYGLASTVWTNNLHTAHRVANKLESGIVWVNTWLLRDLRTPFGGVKNSGVGREGGFFALDFFTEPKNVCIYTPKTI
jgi:aminomuconate-semialdehyde/2-hydroxymuconate-6-semialdehyde dehydrogenase